MKSIPYDDHDGWLEAWQNFIKVWNEKLPNVPLYSDQYYDFISTRVQGWITPLPGAGRMLFWTLGSPSNF